MSKVQEAEEILRELQVPDKQQNAMCCYVLLALAGLSEDVPWKNAGNAWMRIHDMILFLRRCFGVQYAENSRETIRKQALHHFRNAAFIEDNGRATNSPNYRYRLTEEMLTLLQCYGEPLWEEKIQTFLSAHESLVIQYASRRKVRKMPVRINKMDYTFSPGNHNQLQKAILEEFAPRFAPSSICLYVGDTINKDLVKEEATLQELGFDITLHDKMPDIVLYSREKNWVYFIEAVTSVGPMSPKRILEINEMTRHTMVGKIFITAFPDFKTYKKFSADLAWETEVWIAEMPDHMIHLNGDKFLGPRTE